MYKIGIAASIKVHTNKISYFLSCSEWCNKRKTPNARISVFRLSHFPEFFLIESDLILTYTYNKNYSLHCKKLSSHTDPTTE